MNRDFDEVAAAAARATAAKDAARVASVNAIRGMMRALADSLKGGTLRGMPNISTSRNSYPGANVRSKRLDERLPRPPAFDPDNWGRPALAINIRGELVMARRNDVGDINEAPALDEDLRAEDAELVANALSQVMHRHIRAADKTERRFNAIRRLSERINRAIREDPS